MERPTPAQELDEKRAALQWAQHIVLPDDLHQTYEQAAAEIAHALTHEVYHVSIQLPHLIYLNTVLISVPRRWLRMAYCSTCLDGPVDTTNVVLEWGDRNGAPFLVSGQVWGEQNLIGRPAILDFPVGQGHVVTFNFNPLHRDLNRGDQRMLWNAIINWQSIVSSPTTSAK